MWENSVAGVIEVPLKLTRRLRLRRGGEPPARRERGASCSTCPRFAIPAGKDDGKLTIDVGGLALPPGSYCCYLQATTSAPYNRYPQQLDAANVAKAAADKATAELAAAVQKATEAVNAAKAEKVAEKVTAAEKALAEANEKVKQNEAAKVALAAQVKALQPKETAAYGYSTPDPVQGDARPDHAGRPGPRRAAHARRQARRARHDHAPVRLRRRRRTDA